VISKFDRHDMRLLQNSSAFGNLLMALRCGGETETVVKSTIFSVLIWS